MTRLDIRPATRADIEAFTGAPPSRTIRGVVVELDGRIIALGGTYWDGASVVLFSEMTPEMKKFPVTMLKVGRELVRKNRPMAAVAAPDEPRAGAFLERLGFEPVGDSPYGKVYRWKLSLSR